MWSKNPHIRNVIFYCRDRVKYYSPILNVHIIRYSRLSYFYIWIKTIFENPRFHAALCRYSSLNTAKPDLIPIKASLSSSYCSALIKRLLTQKTKIQTSTHALSASKPVIPSYHSILENILRHRPCNMCLSVVAVPNCPNCYHLSTKTTIGIKIQT